MGACGLLAGIALTMAICIAGLEYPAEGIPHVSKEIALKRMKGLTIIQLMFVLLIAGIVGSFVVNVIIDKRCESDPSRALCADRKAAG